VIETFVGVKNDQTPRKQTSWNHRTRSAVMATTMSQVALSSKLVKGNRVSPESFRRQMCCSTWA